MPSWIDGLSVAVGANAMFDDPYLDVPVAWKRPGWASTLSNLYYRLRAVRGYDKAGRRKWYRYIRVERDFLVAAGVDAELVRLACRYYAKPCDGPDLHRLIAFELVVIRLNSIQGNMALQKLSQRRVDVFLPDLPPEFRVPGGRSAAVV